MNALAVVELTRTAEHLEAIRNVDFEARGMSMAVGGGFKAECFRCGKGPILGRVVYVPRRGWAHGGCANKERTC